MSKRKPKVFKQTIKLGDRVQVTREQVEWQVKHIPECKTVGGHILPDAYESVALWAYSAALWYPVIGRCFGYGLPDPDKPGTCFVRVFFECGPFKGTGYFSESDLRKLK